MDAMTEIRTQFLMTVRDEHGRLVNVGAGVDERGRVVLIRTGCDPLPLPMVTTIQYLSKVREAIREAASDRQD